MGFLPGAQHRASSSDDLRAGVAQPFTVSAHVLQATSLAFVGRLAPKNDIGDVLGLKKRLAEVYDCRSVKKADMVHNGWTPKVEIDAQSYRVRADGELLA